MIGMPSRAGPGVPFCSRCLLVLTCVFVTLALRTEAGASGAGAQNGAGTVTPAAVASSLSIAAGSSARRTKEGGNVRLELLADTVFNLRLSSKALTARTKAAAATGADAAPPIMLWPSTLALLAWLEAHPQLVRGAFS